MAAAPGAVGVQVRRGATVLTQRMASRTPPTVRLLAPNGGERLAPGATVRWSASDADGDRLTFVVQYSPDNGRTWQVLATDLVGDSFSLPSLTGFAGSTQARVRVIVSDGFFTAQAESAGTFVVPAQPPRVQITAPASGAVIPSGEPVVLQGQAIDSTDGLLRGARLDWRTDRAGALGTGQELLLTNLAPGLHQITLTATNSAGQSATSTVTIRIATAEETAAGNTVYVPTVRNGAADATFGGTGRTGIQVLNLLKGSSANVQIRFVNADGTTAGMSAPSTIAGGKSQTFFAASLGAPEGFSGSAVVSADAPVAVIVNQLAQDTGLAGSFNGVSDVGRKVHVPVALRGVAGTSTSLYIQNAGAAPTTRIEVKLFSLDGTTPKASQVLARPIAPGAAVELSQAALAELGDGFSGSAVVEADQPVAVVVNQSNGRSLLASAGQTVGASTVYGPLVQHNNGGFSSTLQVQNAGDGGVPVTVKVYSSATGAKVAEQTRTLSPGVATSWPLGSLLGSEDRFVGSVTVEAPGGQVIGVVNQSNGATNQASAYGLFAVGSSTVLAPLVQTANAGWNTGFQVQNVGAASATVTVMVVDTSGNAIDSVPNATRTIPPGKSETWFPITAAGTRVVGSAIATGPPGSRLVGVVNQLNLDSGAVDLFTTYEAIGQ